MLKNRNKIILASASPRRRELLKNENIPFEVIVSTANEKNFSPLGPEHLVIENALLKADDVAKKFPNDIVLGADTIVVLNNKIFGKPKNLQNAIDMLKELQGTTHTVYTGIALVRKHDKKILKKSESSFVTFKKLSIQDIENYITKVNVMDKAGAYAIQEHSNLIIDKISGNFDNVMGLPCQLVKECLNHF